jgi:geranylgeranyl reductase family protein
MSEVDFDLIIIGAGPAGCTTALCLTDSGLRVAVLDKAVLPSDKVCGDALSGTVMKILQRLPGNCFKEFLELEPKLPCWGIRFFSPNGNRLDIPFVLERKKETPPTGYICKRKIFDGFLQDKVKKLTNISLMSGFLVKQIAREKDCFLVKGENEVLKTRFIIGADGSPSMVGRTLGGHSINHEQYCLGARTYFTGIKDLHPQQFIELHFLKDILPAYLWIFPMAEGIANVGLGMLYGRTKTLTKSLPAICQQIIHSDPTLSIRFEKAKMTGKVEVHGLPLGPDKKLISGDGFLLTGDAAGLVDPFSGEGIGNGMESGMIAAEIIKEAFVANDFTAKFLLQYDERVRKKMGRELTTSYKIQRLCSHPFLFNLVVSKANRNKELRELLTKMYTSQDIRDQLKQPSFYLKMLFK